MTRENEVFVRSWFIAHPTKERWNKEIEKGWSGPDGSSKSFDTIFGVRIGETSTDHRDAHLPANLHDWRYQMLRRLRVSGWPLEFLNGLQALADMEYRKGCIRRVDLALDGFRVHLAKVTAWRRWSVLRLLGFTAWRYSDPYPHQG